MSVYDAIKAWQAGKITSKKAMALTHATNVIELRVLAFVSRILLGGELTPCEAAAAKAATQSILMALRNEFTKSEFYAMNGYHRVPISVIVLDSGPLISLAVCRRLRLLGSFDRPIRVGDVAQAECIRDLSRIGSEALSGLFAELNGSFYTVIDTPYLQSWRDAAAQEDVGDRASQAKEIENASAAWIARRFAFEPQPNQLSLLIGEDANFGDIITPSQNPKVCILSTKVFLETLGNYQIIRSADTIFSEINEAVGVLARYYASRPGQLGLWIKANWTDALEKWPVNF